MLKTLQAPPRLGSLQEWVLILTLDRLEDIEHARFRALAQLIADKEKGVEAFEDYMKIAFPSLEGRKSAQKEQAKEALKQWVATGPLKVKPLLQQDKMGKSKLKTRVMAHKADAQQDKLYGKVQKEWAKKQYR